MKITKANFPEVLKNHEKILFKVSNAYSQDREDQMDIVQEIILQIWKSKNRYNPKFQLSTWIYRISLNVAISHYRKASARSRSQARLSEDLLSISDDKSAGDENPALEKLHQFIRKLDKLNKALMLLYLDNFNYREIAATLAITETNVATKISRLKKKIKDQLEKENLYK